MKLEDLPTIAVELTIDDWAAVFPDGDAWDGVYDATTGELRSPVMPAEIARVDKYWAEGGDLAETSLAALMELTDGTWATVVAWCDTTGWDCQSGANWRRAGTRDEAIRMGLDKAARANLGVELDGER